MPRNSWKVTIAVHSVPTPSDDMEGNATPAFADRLIAPVIIQPNLVIRRCDDEMWQVRNARPMLHRDRIGGSAVLSIVSRTACQGAVLFHVKHNVGHAGT